MRVAIAVLALTANLSIAFAQESILLPLGRISPVSRVTTPVPFKTVRVGDPKIVDVLPPETNRYVDLQAVARGYTNIVFYDENGNVIKDLTVIVDEGGPQRVEIHNKSLLTSHTTYQCWANGCRYVNELTAQEPAPQPPTTNNNYNYNVVKPAPLQ